MVDLKGKRVLVTGGAGFIGSHIVDLLCDEDCSEIVALDNMVRGRPENLSHASSLGSIRLVDGDIRDRKLMSSLVRDADVVFHQAALRITHCAAEPRLAMEVMVQATFDLLELCVEHEVEKVIAASSASVYGLADEFPTTERQNPYDNRTLYGAAKAFNEGLLRTFNDMYGLDYVAFRYFNVYGNRMDIHGRYTEVLIRWMERLNAGQAPIIFGDGLQTMDFIHVRDIARANLLGAKANATDEVFNIASGTETSLAELAAALTSVMGQGPLAVEYAPERSVNPVPRRLASTKKAEELLGFKAQVPLDAGLRELVEWWRGESRPRRAGAGGRSVVIPIALPFLEQEEADAASAAVLSGWVSQGPQVAAFEREFAALVNAPYASAVSNCTTALHLALLALDLKPGDEVITASHSFIATANCIRYCGAIPVFVDIDQDTYNIDPARVAEAITPRTRAILAVHQMGMPCDLAALLKMASDNGIVLIEDAACAAGSQVKVDGQWGLIGKPHGHVACFSFHPRKVITTGEGGMLTTADSAFDRRFRLLRQHGMSVSDVARHSSSQVIFEEYLEVGFNYRMTDMQAAVGRKQLTKLAWIVDRRRAIADRYRTALGNIEGLILPYEPEWARSNWQSYCVRLPQTIDRNALMQKLLDRGVTTRRGIMCSHREAPYAASPRRHDLRQSELAQDGSILLPIYAQMTEIDQNFVTESLRNELFS